MEGTNRLFIAFNVSEPAAAVLADAIDNLSRRINGVKWVSRKGLHITLHFLGAIKEAAAGQISSALKQAAAGLEPVRYRLAGVDAFPDRAAPRVIIVRLDELTGLKAGYWQKALGQSLGVMGIEADHRPWQAHVTIGRVKSARVILPPISIPQAEFKVESVELMSSRLTPAGAVYTQVASYELGKK